MFVSLCSWSILLILLYYLGCYLEVPSFGSIYQSQTFGTNSYPKHQWKIITTHCVITQKCAVIIFWCFLQRINKSIDSRFCLFPLILSYLEPYYKFTISSNIVHVMALQRFWMVQSWSALVKDIFRSQCFLDYTSSSHKLENSVLLLCMFFSRPL